MLKLEFWHVPHPEFNLRFVFARCFLTKKMRHLTGCTVQKISELSFSHRFFRCFLRVSHFASFFSCGFADSRPFAHASLSFHLYFSSVQGWGGGRGGLMTSMPMRLCLVFCFLTSFWYVLVRYIGGEGRRDGGVMTSMRMRLLCCVSLVVLCFVHWWGRGGWGHFASVFAVFS